MALMAKINSATGAITTVGTVDGVHFAEMEILYEEHAHWLGDHVAEATETLPIWDGSGVTNVHTASDAAGAGATYEHGHGDTVDWAHSHNMTGASDTRTDGASTGADNDNLCVLDSATGDIDCDTMDDVSPKDLYERYNGHWHEIPDARVQSRTLSGGAALGNSGHEFFRMAANNAGDDPKWVKVTHPGGSHTHSSGGDLTLTAFAAPAQPARGSSTIIIDHATGNISTGGRVNGIDISTFNTGGGNHRHNTAGNTGYYGARNAQITGTLIGRAYCETSSGVWELIYAHAAQHRHSHAGIYNTSPGSW